MRWRKKTAASGRTQRAIKTGPDHASQARPLNNCQVEKYGRNQHQLRRRGFSGKNCLAICVNGPVIDMFVEMPSAEFGRQMSVLPGMTMSICVSITMRVNAQGRCRQEREAGQGQQNTAKTHDPIIAYGMAVFQKTALEAGNGFEAFRY